MKHTVSPSYEAFVTSLGFHIPQLLYQLMWLKLGSKFHLKETKACCTHFTRQTHSKKLSFLGTYHQLHLQTLHLEIGQRYHNHSQFPHPRKKNTNITHASTMNMSRGNTFACPLNHGETFYKCKPRTTVQ